MIALGHAIACSLLASFVAEPLMRVVALCPTRIDMAGRDRRESRRGSFGCDIARCACERDDARVEAQVGAIRSKVMD